MVVSFTYGGKGFALLIIDVSKTRIYYIEPSTNVNQQNSIRFSEERRKDLANAIMTVISTIAGAPEGIVNWNSEYYHASNSYNSYDPLIPYGNDSDAGLYLILILDLLCYDLPLSFHSGDIAHVRYFYLYHLLNDNLAIHS